MRLHGAISLKSVILILADFFKVTCSVFFEVRTQFLNMNVQGLHLQNLITLSRPVEAVHTRPAKSAQRLVSDTNQLPWWCRQYAPLKRRPTSTWLHGATSQNTLNFILVAVKTWNLSHRYCFSAFSLSWFSKYQLRRASQTNLSTR
jgi:hypothetical protein